MSIRNNEPAGDIEMLTVKEVASWFGMSEYSVREHCRKRTIPHIRLGERTIRFIKSDIEKWIHDNVKKNYLGK